LKFTYRIEINYQRMVNFEDVNCINNFFIITSNTYNSNPILMISKCQWLSLVNSSPSNPVISLSPHFNGHFPGEPGLAGVYWSKGWWRWWWHWSYKSCKAPVKSSSPTNQHPVFYRPDALPVTQPTVSKHWREKYHIQWNCLPQAHLGVFQLCLWPLTAPGYLWERVAMPLISPLMPVPHIKPCHLSKKLATKHVHY